jgi:carbamoyl-phosphate synthase small subunit
LKLYPFFLKFNLQMKYQDRPKAIILLEDGTIFWGKAVGKLGTATGEICFNTGMTGYQEIFTDPSYFGQIMVATNAHIGNYGVHPEEIESETIKIAGLVVKNFSFDHSRPDAEGNLLEYLERDSLMAISDVDTRALVRHIRDRGAMNAIISSENLDPESLKMELAKVPSMAGLELSSKVSCTESYEYGAGGELRIAALDVGIKKNILRNLAERGAHIRVFPMNTPYTEMAAWNPDGYFLSNGPGDPAAMPQVVLEVQKILDSRKPVFGICLGHQLIAQALGLRTYKMHNGHRGINHPVKNLLTGRGEITSQNHGFVVNMDDLNKHPEVELTHVHLNDKTVAGMRLKSKSCFSVQYHPESSPGPHDSRYLFDEFIDMMKKQN